MTTQTTVKIGSDFSFIHHKSKTIFDTQCALTLYSSSYQKALKLEGDYPIFLDTNILLGYYGMSIIEKEKLIQFFENYKERIIISKQAEKEFLKNRLSVIRKDFFSPLNKVAEDYKRTCNEITGAFQNYREKKKKILSQDYPEIWIKIQEIDQQIRTLIVDEDLIKDLENKIGEIAADNKFIAIIDKLLEISSTFRTTNELDEVEINFIKELYDKCIEEFKSANDTNKSQFCFPGSGDKKDDPTGDFIIYHEIIKYMQENNCSCIFLTNDVEKGDWLQEDKNPHIHYIENTYLATNNVMYILHAEQLLPSISFENIHKETIKLPEIIQPESAQEKESAILSVNKARGFGFIYTRGGNRYFNYSDMINGDFVNLEKDDIVKFTEDLNQYGEPVAKNVYKIEYSFESPISPVIQSRISHINHYRGFGYIIAQPENIYFHQVAFNDDNEFSQLKEGTEIEYIAGKTPENELIARIVRIKK
jgi:cold shock CspA family protein